MQAKEEFQNCFPVHTAIIFDLGVGNQIAEGSTCSGRTALELKPDVSCAGEGNSFGVTGVEESWCTMTEAQKELLVLRTLGKLSSVLKQATMVQLRIQSPFHILNAGGSVLC